MSKDTLILLDNGHGSNTKGKQSPDGRLKEYAYAREIVKRVYNKLKQLGYNPYILVPEDTDISLSTRVSRANTLYKNNNKNAILISVHCNAAGNGSQWLSAKGWSVFVSQNASKNSIKLADSLKEQADKEKVKVRLQYSNKSYWVQSLAMCRDTNCPAVLTENFFQDNKDDVNFLLSEEGKEIVTNIHVNGIINYLNN